MPTEAPSAAPAAAPAAPPPSSTPPAPPSKPSAPTADSPPESGSKWLDEIGHDIEGLDDGRPVPKPGENPEDKTPAKPGEVKPPGKPDEPPADKPTSETPAKPVKVAELRAAYEGLKKEKAEVLQPTIQRLEARIKELESTTPEATNAITEKLTAAEKRAADLESRIQFVDYQRSAEFQTKYVAPYTEAWNRAIADFSQLQVRVPDGEDDITHEPKFTNRAATADDLLYLANLPLSQMDDQAEALFGKSAARVIRHVERVRELSEAQNKALADAQKKSGDWVKERQTQFKQIQQQQQTLWTQFNKEIATRFPQMFAPIEGDEEGNALLKKGFEMADRLFAPTKETAPKTMEEKVQLHAMLRNKIANHDRLARRLKTVMAELDQAKKDLAEYERSAPPGGGGGSGASKAPAKTLSEEVEDEINKLDRQ